VLCALGTASSHRTGIYTSVLAVGHPVCIWGGGGAESPSDCVELLKRCNLHHPLLVLAVPDKLIYAVPRRGAAGNMCGFAAGGAAGQQGGSTGIRSCGTSRYGVSRNMVLIWRDLHSIAVHACLVARCMVCIWRDLHSIASLVAHRRPTATASRR
jgi:hypothetical protein